VKQFFLLSFVSFPHMPVCIWTSYFWRKYSRCCWEMLWGHSLRPGFIRMWNQKYEKKEWNMDFSRNLRSLPEENKWYTVTENAFSCAKKLEKSLVHWKTWIRCRKVTMQCDLTKNRLNPIKIMCTVWRCQTIWKLEDYKSEPASMR